MSPLSPTCKTSGVFRGRINFGARPAPARNSSREEAPAAGQAESSYIPPTYSLVQEIIVCVPGAMGYNGHILWCISSRSYRQQVGNTCTRALRDILLSVNYLAFSAMRALALAKSRAFSTLIFLLSLGCIVVNVVRVLRFLGERTRTRDVIYTR